MNNNYAGIQADCGTWSGLSGAVGTCIRKDSGGAIRRFICFGTDGYKNTLDLLLYASKKRGMYIGATGVTDTDTLDLAYINKWVGRKEIHPDSSFHNLYEQASKLIA